MLESICRLRKQLGLVVFMYVKAPLQQSARREFDERDGRCCSQMPPRWRPRG